MTLGPPDVDPDTPISEVVKIMQQQGVSSVLVGKLGNAEGIISEADIVRKVLAQDLDITKINADQIMTSPLISVEVTTSVYKIS